MFLPCWKICNQQYMVYGMNTIHNLFTGLHKRIPYNTYDFINNVQGNSKLHRSILFYTGSCRYLWKYFELTSWLNDFKYFMNVARKSKRGDEVGCSSIHTQLYYILNFKLTTPDIYFISNNLIRDTELIAYC